METAASVREFWFGTEEDDGRTAQQQSALWWKKHPETDRMIRDRFGAALELAVQGRLDDWLSTPQGRLSLILLTDQFPRNMYRDTARAFAYDGAALAWCRAGLEQGADQDLRPIERVFFYLPLEHSEELEDQELAVSLFERLQAGLPASLQPAFQTFLDFARRHHEIIARFGRFPHRNRILGRESTPEEAAFLQQPGSGF